MSPIKDIELIKALQERFDEKNKALEELHKLTKELQNVNKKLSKSEELKTHFISNITNEIVNPFASILGISQSLKSVEQGNWDQLRNMASLIHEEAFSLDFQLKNIFAAAQLEAGEAMPNYDVVQIKPMVERVLDNFKHEAQKRGIEFELECVNCNDFITDPEKLSLVISNLVSNAVKFSSKEGTVHVKLQKTDQNLELELVVTDQGIGISTENQTIIFDRFERLDTGINSINRGHGLGLSINKAVIELLDGTIEVKSEIGKGASFKVKLPKPAENCIVGGFTSDADELFFGDDEIF